MAMIETRPHRRLRAIRNSFETYVAMARGVLVEGGDTKTAPNKYPGANHPAGDDPAVRAAKIRAGELESIAVGVDNQLRPLALTGAEDGRERARRGLEAGRILRDARRALEPAKRQLTVLRDRIASALERREKAAAYPASMTAADHGESLRLRDVYSRMGFAARLKKAAEAAAAGRPEPARAVLNASPEERAEWAGELTGPDADAAYDELKTALWLSLDPGAASVLDALELAADALEADIGTLEAGFASFAKATGADVFEGLDLGAGLPADAR